MGKDNDYCVRQVLMSLRMKRRCDVLDRTRYLLLQSSTTVRVVQEDRTKEPSCLQEVYICTEHWGYGENPAMK